MAEVFQIPLSDGELLRGNKWTAQKALYNLTVITGMNEYSLRYAPFAEWMTAAGVNVWVLDAFGQGLNAESRERQQRWPEAAFTKQVAGLRKMVRLASKNGLPTYLMGHSMGSFMVQAFLEKYPNEIAGAVICGSNGGQGLLMKTGFRLSKLLVGKENRDEECPVLQKMGLGGYAKAVRDRETEFDWLSYDRENVRKYIDDPWCGQPNTGGFWQEFLKGMSGLWDRRNMRRVSPEERIFIIAGADDPVGRNGRGPKWLEKAYRKLGVKEVDLRLYKGMRHEVLREAEKEKVFSDILAFIRGRN